MTYENTNPEYLAGKKDKWSFYQDKSDGYRWRRTALNGKVVGASCEGFPTQQMCDDNAVRQGWDGKTRS